MLDLLHNFFPKSGARTHQARCYEMTSNETARIVIGYLLVRGGVHQASRRAIGRRCLPRSKPQCVGFAPQYAPEDLYEIAQKLVKRM